MKYVTPEYQQQLDNLAETLMAARREKLGQLALFEMVPDNVIYVDFGQPTPPEVA